MTSAVGIGIGRDHLLMAYVLVRGFKLLERWLRVDACQGR